MMKKQEVSLDKIKFLEYGADLAREFNNLSVQ
jgi:hypothetical protein